MRRDARPVDDAAAITEAIAAEAPYFFFAAFFFAAFLATFLVAFFAVFLALFFAALAISHPRWCWTKRLKHNLDMRMIPARQSKLQLCDSIHGAVLRKITPARRTVESVRRQIRRCRIHTRAMFDEQIARVVCKRRALRYRPIRRAARTAMTIIYHLADRAAWTAARSLGVYDGTTQDKADGFIHFSTAAQVIESAAKHRKGVKNLVLLAVDDAVLGTALRWEPARGGQLFPHLFGALPTALVQAVHDLPLDAEGRHVFPSLDT
jgi:uncharacterized protein (DUF952 family)